MKKEIGSQELKNEMIKRFKKEVDYYGDSDLKQYFKYYNRLENEKLSNKKKVFVSVIRLKGGSNYKSIMEMGFSLHSVIPVKTYHDKNKAEIVIIEFNH